MAIGDYELLGRAVRILRAAPEPGWYAVESDVIAAVVATPRGGWPLDVDDPEPSAAGVIRVSDRVVSSALSRALRSDPEYVVTDISVQSNDGVLERVSIEISVRYLADMASAAERARDRGEAVLADVIGPRARGRLGVAVTDVHR